MLKLTGRPGMQIHAQGVQASPSDGQLVPVSGVILDQMGLVIPWRWGYNGGHGGVCAALEAGGVRVYALPGASLPSSLPWQVVRLGGLRGPVQRGLSTESWVAGAVALNKALATLRAGYQRALPTLLNVGSYPFGVDSGPNAYLGGSITLALTSDSNLRLSATCYNAGYSSKFSWEVWPFAS